MAETPAPMADAADKSMVMEVALNMGSKTAGAKMTAHHSEAGPSFVCAPAMAISFR
jgi:hypothetical protein